MPSVNFFFSDWEPILRIVLVAPLAYLALVVLLRASGKRTLAQLNSFDFVITVAIGATLGRFMTARSVPLAEVLTAFVVLIALQFALTWLRVRWKPLGGIVTASPTLLYYRGQILDAALKDQRLTRGELHAAARQHGLGSLGEAEAVVMESDGKLAVVKPGSAGDGSALDEVSRP